MSLPSIKNRVGCATSTTGTGTITLGAAESGYQSFSTAYGADANVDLLIEDGTAWEIARDCTYSHSGGTVTRGTLEASSTGSAISLSGAAKAYVIAGATRLQRMVGGYLEHASHDGTANVTGVVGTLHVFTGLTADRTFTLPSGASAGDRVGVSFPGGSASYEILLKSASGDKVNNVDCSTTEWSRLFIAGEVVIFRCVDGSTVDWVVEYDGRIPCYVYLSEAMTISAAWTTTFPAWTGATNPHGLVDTTNKQVVVRRAGRYIVTTYGAANMASVSGTYPSWGGSTYSSAAWQSAPGDAIEALAAGGTIKPGWGTSNTGTVEVRIGVAEVL